MIKLVVLYDLDRKLPVGKASLTLDYDGEVRCWTLRL
jgi:hypothetical protein